MNEELNYARLYLSKGLSVIPLRPKSNSSAVDQAEFHKRLPTDEELKEWFLNKHRCNVGIITGNVSGIIVARIFPPKLHPEEVKQIIWKTPTVKMPNGLDLYYRMPNECGELKLKENLANVRLISQENYVVAPPSFHRTYGGYLWKQGNDLGNLPLVDLPEYFIAKE